MTEMLTTEPRPAEPDAAEENTIRPFQIDVPEDELVDLRRRIEATRWPATGRQSTTGASARRG